MMNILRIVVWSVVFFVAIGVIYIDYESSRYITILQYTFDNAPKEQIIIQVDKQNIKSLKVITPFILHDHKVMVQVYNENDTKAHYYLKDGGDTHKTDASFRFCNVFYCFVLESKLI